MSSLLKDLTYFPNLASVEPYTFVAFSQYSHVPSSNQCTQILELNLYTKRVELVSYSPTVLMMCIAIEITHRY